MGYRKYAKDYVIDYVPVKGKKREKAVRTYIGPYFRFQASPERIDWLRRFYVVGLGVQLLLLLLPLFVDCGFTRLWYVVLPFTCAWIPWIFAACACWRLWTAGEKVDRQHYDLLHDRMAGSTLILMGFSLGAAAGCVVGLGSSLPAAADYVICAAALLSAVCAMVLFSKRKELDMEAVENPEAKKWQQEKENKQ